MDPKKAQNAGEYKQYCLPATFDLIYKSKNLYFIIGKDEEEKKAKIGKEEEKIREQDLVDKFRDFEISESKDIIKYDEVKILVDERLLQIYGHLFKYDSETDKNLLVKQSCFICFDRLHG